MTRARLAALIPLACAFAACSEIAGLDEPPSSLLGGADASNAAPDREAPDTSAPGDDGPASDTSASEGDAPAPDASPSDGGDSADSSTPVPQSCADIKRYSPDAGSGTYSIVADGKSIDVYCDMTMDDGGWTAFFVDQLGADRVVAHFDDVNTQGALVDYCPSPASQCLHHLPSSVTAANDFAVACGNDALRFKVPGTLVLYWKLGQPWAWQPLLEVTPIAGTPNRTFAAYFDTGSGVSSPTYEGWIITSAMQNTATPNTFASAYSAGGWDFCNGADYNDAGADAATPMVWLFYR